MPGRDEQRIWKILKKIKLSSDHDDEELSSDRGVKKLRSDHGVEKLCSELKSEVNKTFVPDQ